MLGFLTRQKKLLLALTLVALLLWLVTAQVKGGRFLFLEKPVLAVSGFFERIITGTYDGARGLWGRYLFLVSTRRENLRLTQEVERLRVESQLANELLIENERLREALGFAKLHPPQSVTIQVIGKDVTPASTTVTVNKGSEAGLAKGMAVIAPTGVVGRVEAATGGTAKVALVTDPGVAIAVRVQRNREEGLLEGRLSHCVLKYVSFYADIQQGDLLVTSGLDGVYPKGLPVAYVVKVNKHESRPFQDVVAKPVAGLSQLEEALVLLK